MNAQVNWHIFFGASVALTVLLGFGIYHLVRNRLCRPSENAPSMFRDLCRIHDLSGCQRKLMQRLAHGLKLASPSALFVDSSLWRIPEDGAGGNELSKKEWDKLLAIRRMLFLPASPKI